MTYLLRNFLRLKISYPEFFDLRIQYPLFKQDSANNPVAMASSFGLPYLGKLPMDPNILKSCEEGKSFVDQCPLSVAVVPFNLIIDQIIESCVSLQN